MNEYHKIHTVFKRDPKTNHKTLLEGDFSLPEFEYLANNKWIFTEKVDGTNIRVMFDGEQVTFRGRDDNSEVPDFLVQRLNGIFSLQAHVFKEVFPDGICLYGEGYGAKIQKVGGNYRVDQGFVLFDVRIGDWWLRRDDVEKVARKLAAVEVVPIIGEGTLYEMVEMARTGFKSVWGDFTAEGIVARPAVELKGRDGSRIITKIKRRDFRHSKR